MSDLLLIIIIAIFVALCGYGLWAAVMAPEDEENRYDR